VKIAKIPVLVASSNFLLELLSQPVSYPSHIIDFHPFVVLAPGTDHLFLHPVLVEASKYAPFYCNKKCDRSKDKDGRQA
jgi:hypothetical protein